MVTASHVPVTPATRVKNVGQVSNAVIQIIIIRRRRRRRRRRRKKRR